MSDFLSKFNKDGYGDLVAEQAKEKSKKNEQEAANTPEESGVDAVSSDNSQDATVSGSGSEKKDSAAGNQANQDSISDGKPKSRSSYRQDADEELEIDQDYKRKKRRNLIITIASSIVALVIIYFIYHALVHVKVEDFVDKSLTEARAWAKENGVEIELEQEYSMETEVNQIISQGIEPGKKIRKGKALNLVSSLGPDPEELIELPDFSIMTQSEAYDWIEEHKADSIQLVTEYHDTIERDSFIKFEIRDKSILPEEYKRQDNAILYYSLGEEPLEKNVPVPNFIGGMLEDVEKWAEANEIELTTTEGDSDTIEVGLIVSQSVVAEEKVARRDKFEVVVSIGKSVVVPNFAGMTAEEAMMASPDLNVMVKQVFHSKVAYGKLISQSIPEGTKLTDKDDKNITVTYSEGRPYLRDYRGHLEGDLPSLFYDDYQSKGADIKYTVKVVDSEEEKGTVVKMSKFNEYVPMSYTVEISISNNAIKPVEPPVYEEELPVDDFVDEGDPVETGGNPKTK